MNTKEALLNAISALKYRIDCVQPLIDSPYLSASKDFLEAGQDRDTETIKQLTKKILHLEAKD